MAWPGSVKSAPLLLVAALLTLSPSIAAAEVRCQYRASDYSLHVEMTEGTVHVVLDADPEIRVVEVVGGGHNMPTFHVQVTCEDEANPGEVATPTVTTTDSIVVSDLTGHGNRLDVGGEGFGRAPGLVEYESAGGGVEAFAPGVEDESPGSSEIEIAYVGGAGKNVLTLDAGDSSSAEGAQFFTLGSASEPNASAASVNAGAEAELGLADADITASAVERIEVVDLGAGEDRVDAAGGAPFSAPLASRLAVWSAGSGNDFLRSGANRGVLLGYAGDDRLVGGSGHDLLLGHGGGDALIGRGGRDHFYPEDFWPFGSIGNDHVDGGSGLRDRIELASGGCPTGIRVDLRRRGPQATGCGSDRLRRVEIVAATSYDDILIGDGAANTFLGFDGADRIRGSGGPDTLTGHSGSDTLRGERGIDFIDAAERNGSDRDHRISCGLGADRREQAEVDPLDPEPMSC